MARRVVCRFGPPPEVPKPFAVLAKPRFVPSGLPSDVAAWYRTHEGVGLSASARHDVRLGTLAELQPLHAAELGGAGDASDSAGAGFRAVRVAVGRGAEVIAYVVAGTRFRFGSIVAFALGGFDSGALVLDVNFSSWMARLKRDDWVEWGLSQGGIGGLPGGKAGCVAAALPAAQPRIDVVNSRGGAGRAVPFPTRPSTAPSAMASVSLRGLTKSYSNGVAALQPFSLELPAGERLVLVGPGGGGKTTLLRLIAGLEVARRRRDPHRRRPRQRRAAAPARGGPGRAAARILPANDRVGEPPGRYGAPIADALDLLRLGPLAQRRPHELSGGEQQRIALARLLVRRPAVWLLDEPLAALDPAFRSEFRADLHLLLNRLLPTMILVTHDPTDAPALGRRVGVLECGFLRQVGTPDELRDRPGNRSAALALGRFAIIKGCVVGGDPSGRTFVAEAGPVSLPLPPRLAARAEGRPGSRLTLGTRPEDFLRRTPEGPPPDEPGATLDGWPVVLAEPDGSGWLLTLGRPSCRLRVAWPSGPPPAVGALTHWFLPAGRCVWFDPDSGDRID